MKVTIPNNWGLRHYQRKGWEYLQNGGKRYVPVWHRRAGKDGFSLNWTAVAMCQRVGSYWHMFPEASQARKGIWDAVDEFTGIRHIDQAFPKEFRANTRESDMFIRLKNGSTWQVVGSDNYDSLIGSPPIGLVLSEFAYANPVAWQKLSPILLNNGGWAIFPSTPFGRNHFHGLHEHAKTEPGWFTEVLTVDDTGVMTREQILSEERQLAAQRGAQEAHAIIRQEYYCSFDAAIPGAYYGPTIETMERCDPPRITTVPYDPGFMVETWWDLGIRDDTAIWFVQKCGREYRIIDYYEASGVGLDHYAQILRTKQYNYAPKSCVLPHDASHGQLTQRGGASLADVLTKQYGYATRVVPQTNSLEWSINQVRSFLPTCVFDKTRCKDGLEKLRMYRRKWNEATRAFHLTPLHDYCSHAADAFRTGVEGLNDIALQSNPSVNYQVANAFGGSAAMDLGYVRRSTPIGYNDDPLGRD